MENLPKLVVSDIGGTLVDSGSRIPDFTGNVFDKIIKRDIPVILITGFNYHTTRSYAKNLNENIIQMPQNGTICLKDNEVIWEYRIDKEPIKTIYDYLDGEFLPIIVYKGIEEDFAVLYKGRGVIKRDHPFKEIDHLDDLENITGISTVIAHEKIEIVSRKIKDIIGDNFQMIRVKEKDYYWLEVTPKNVRKDLAIERYCKENSISLDDVMFFGDNYNDLELLRKVGKPVIVDNAVYDLKNEFKTVCPPVYEEGVGKYLRNIFELDGYKR